MKKTRELKGMPVLALEEGERLGQVRGLILDPVARQVVALILDRRVGGEDQIVATANIRTVGPAAITVENRSSLIPLSRIPRFQELARQGKPIQGKMVISEAGERLGQVDDLEVDVETFGLVSLVLKAFLRHGQVIPADRVRTIGTDAIVVCEEKPEGAPVAVSPAPVPEPAPPPSPAPAPQPFVPPSPVEEPAPVPEPAPVEEHTPVLAPEETTASPEAPAAPAVEPEVAPSDAETQDPDLEPGPTEKPAGEEEENAWQRWVRRLKSG
jgi:uncharacterized protein YrrD